MSLCRVAKPSIGKGKLSAKDWFEYYTESHEHSQHKSERVPKNVGDYYVGQSGDAERPPVKLLGKGVAALGLDADHELTRDEFELLCDGRTLDGKAAIHRGADGSHVPFIALAYSPHKSVSLLWALGDDELRAAIQAAHDTAVREAVASLERHTAPLRRQDRSTGKIVPERTAGLVVAEVRHHTARPVTPTGNPLIDIPDPQLHTHALVMNMALRATPDGKGNQWGAIDSRALLVAQRESGKVYGTALAAELRKLGFGVERHSDAIGVAGISDELVSAFSRRHAEIDKARSAEANRRGRALTPAERQAQVLATRRPKGEPVKATSLLIGWQIKLAALGANPELPAELRALEAERRAVALDRVTPAQVVAAAVDGLGETKGTWSWQDLRTAIATEAQGRLEAAELDDLLCRADEAAGSPAAVVVPMRDLGLAAISPDLVPVVAKDGKAALTSKAVLDRDRECLNLVAEINSGGAALVPIVIANHETLKVRAGDMVLTTEQAEAAWRLSSSRVSVLEAPPGTGKSVVGRAIAEGWAKATRTGRFWDPINRRLVESTPAPATIWATALPGKAADDLGAGLGDLAQVRTLDGLRRETLGRNDLVIVDEASMVDQARWLPLLRQVRDAGCRVALIGDRQQQGTVTGPGGLFAYLADQAAERGELATIKANYRAQDGSDAQAWDALREGQSDRAISHYKAQGRVVLAPSVDDMRTQAVKDWAADIAGGRDALIVTTGSNREIDEINAACQAEMIAAGRVADGPAIPVSYTDPTTGYERSELLRVGDRVALTQTSYLDAVGNRQQTARTRVNNGESLTVTEIADNRIVLSRRLGALVEIADERVNRLRLDYACSALRSQGRTVDRVRVLAHPQANQETGYVAITRAREGSWVYGSIRELTGWPDGMSQARAEAQAITALAESFGRSRPQELAVTAANRAARQGTEREIEERMRRQELRESPTNEIALGNVA